MKTPALPLFVALAASLAASQPAFAADQGVIDWSAQAGVASDYVSKGVSKSNGDPEVWGRLEASHGDLFAGGYLTSADIYGADSEAQAYVGYRPEALGYQWEFAATYKTFPGAAGGVDKDLIEFRADVSRSVGPASARLRVEYTPDNSGPAKQALWVEARAGWKFSPKTQLTAALAKREQDGGRDYTAWNLGVNQKLTDHLAADVRWYDTDGHDFGDNYDGRLVGALTVAF